MTESRMVRVGQRVDVAGAVTATGGLVAIVYGLLQAASHPWVSWQVLAPLAGGAGLLAVMVAVEARSAAPLIPLRFFTNRTRVTANVVTLFFTAAFFTCIFLLTLFEQQVLGYSPLEGGLSYLPLGIGIGAGMGLGTALMPRLGVRPLIAASFLGTAAGLLLASGIHPGTSYPAGVLPGMIVLGMFSGMGFPASAYAALHKVTSQDSSLASAVQNVVQQAGRALGLACLVTLALRHVAGQVRHGAPAAVAAAHGYALSFRIGAVLLAAGGVLALVLFEHLTARPRKPAAESPAQPVGPALQQH